MSSSTQSRDAGTLELRVLYGPQAGSRMPLAAGEYLLGRSDQCAVVLAGSRMEERHALLLVDANGFRLRPQEGRVSDSLGNVVDDSIAFEAGSPAELGGVSITIDHPDAPWPEDRPAAQVAMVPPTPEASGQPAQEPFVAGAVSSPCPDDRAAHWTRLLKSRFSGRLASLPGTRARLRGLWLAGAGVAAIAAFAMTAVLAAVLVDAGENGTSALPPRLASVAGIIPSQPAPEAPLVPPEALTRALRASDPKHSLAIQPQPEGRWAVSGYVATEADKKILQQGLATLVPQPELRVHAEEAIVRSAVEALDAREDGKDDVLKLQNLGKGRLRLGGAARQASSVRSARLALMVVPGVVDVETGVLLPEQLLATLKQRIEAAGLAQRLVFAKEWPEVVVEGRLDAAEHSRWSGLMKAFTDAYGAVLPVRSTAVAAAPASPATTAAPLDVRVIVGGASPYVVTAQGVRMSRGSEVNGQRLLAVNDAEAVFDGAQRWQVGR
jgi:type III secretion system YscD/HrpQ family protein